MLLLTKELADDLQLLFLTSVEREKTFTMDDFMNIERNPIMKILAQESDIDYVNDAVAFLFVVSVLRTVKGQYATKILRTLIRCYAALAFVMPLMLGSLPSGMMKDVDHYAMLVVGAMIFEMVPLGNIHPQIEKLVNTCAGWSYCIVKANACAAGYHAFAKAFPGSTYAPFMGAFVATNGHLFIEKGMAAFDLNTAGNKDNKLAVFGGVMIMLMEGQMAMSAMVTKGLLSALNIGQDYIDFDGMVKQGTGVVNNLAGAITNLAGAKKMKSSTMKKGRSATPKRK